MHVIKDGYPFCEEELKPRQGLEFINLEECENFINLMLVMLGFVTPLASGR